MFQRWCTSCIQTFGQRGIVHRPRHLNIKCRISRSQVKWFGCVSCDGPYVTFSYICSFTKNNRVVAYLIQETSFTKMSHLIHHILWNLLIFLIKFHVWSFPCEICPCLSSNCTGTYVWKCHVWSIAVSANERTDRRTLPSALSPCFAKLIRSDKNISYKMRYCYEYNLHLASWPGELPVTGAILHVHVDSQGSFNSPSLWSSSFRWKGRSEGESYPCTFGVLIPKGSQIRRKRAEIRR